MFEGIGRSTDDEAGKRRAASAGLTSVLLVSLVGFWVGVAALTVTAIVAPPDDGTIVHFPDDPEPELQIAQVDLPPAPPKERVKKGGGEATEKQNDEFDENIRPLDVPPIETVAPQTHFGNGPKKGPGIGECEGDDCIDAPIIGDPNGGKGPRRVHHTEVDRRKVVDPSYPKAAKGMDLGRVSCKVLVTIDRKGVPTSATVEDCPLVFHPESKDAMLRSRWYAPNVEGERLNSAQFLVVIHFDLR